MTYAFTFDASACTGCKACQVACKDKNNLPTGVLWRRVYEVSGGSWTNVGPPGVWTTNVFAYNLSIACNHCVHPKCAGVCPTDAYVVRDDGIVYIDESKCMGCGYCAWACPYTAPKYNPELRHMTKCNLCFDNLDAGLPPACVAACPMRVLDFVEVSSEQLSVNSFRELWEIQGAEHPFPLPTFSRTQPHLAINPHVGMVNGLEKAISNQEEVKPPTRVRRTLFNGTISSEKKARLTDFLPTVWCDALRTPDELPLVIFTLSSQTAAGMAVFSLFAQPSTFNLLTIGFLLGLAGLVSLLHLGTPLNAWRALNHLKKSSLSREILWFGFFGASWLACLALPGMGKGLLALTGLGLVYYMAQVYQIKAVPAWNTWRTPAAFFLTAGILGALAVSLAANQPWLASVAGVLLAAKAALEAVDRHPLYQTARRLRLGLILLGMAGALILAGVPGSAVAWIRIPIFLLILMEEIVERGLFYTHLHQKVL